MITLFGQGWDVELLQHEKAAGTYMEISSKWHALRIYVVHCKDTIPKIRKQIFPEKELRGHSPNFPHSCLCEQFIYFQLSISITAAGKCVDRTWKYINRSQTHECEKWGLRPRKSQKRIHKWDFRYSVDDGHCSRSYILYAVISQAVTLLHAIRLYSFWSSYFALRSYNTHFSNSCLEL